MDFQPLLPAVEQFAQTDSLFLGHYRPIKANFGQAVSVFCIRKVLLGKLLLICFSEKSTLGLTAMEEKARARKWRKKTPTVLKIIISQIK